MEGFAKEGDVAARGGLLTIFLDSMLVAPELVQAWVCTYHCSQQALPPLAHGTFSLGTHVAV